jgi:hypothetical protein
LNANEQEEPSHAFLLRLWAGKGGDGKKIWRGKVQNIVYGEAQDFDSWAALINRLVSMLPTLELEQPRSDIEENELC